MKELNFLHLKKKFNKIDVKNKTCINVFCYENKFTYPVHISYEKFEKWICGLYAMKINHVVYIKDFD